MSLLAQIRGITFDVGGTLIEPWPSVGQVYADVAARHGMKNVSAAILDERFRAAWRASRDFDYTRAGWERLVQQTFHGFANSSSWTNFFSDLYERFAEAEVWRVFDDVRPALDALASRGIRLGVVSNWDERLRVLLQRLRLDRHFETFAISCEVGFAKPSPVVFEHAAAGLGLPPSAILHVGDSEELDVQGAKSAGFQALRIVRNCDDAGGGCVTSLNKLAAED